MTRSEPPLEERLSRLSGELRFPPTPDVAGSIGQALPERRFPRRPRRRYAMPAIAIAALMIVAFLPGPRHALADLFGLPGIQISIGERGTTGEQPISIGSSLLLGEKTTLREAQDRVPFPILVPAPPGMPNADETWLRDTGDVVAVSLIYRPGPDLPEIGATGVGMLLMEIRSPEEAPFLAKRALGHGSLAVVSVDGEEAFWVDRGELVVLSGDIIDPDAAARRSGHVLIWSDGETTFRLETSLDQATAIAIAESLEPIIRSGSGG